MVLGIRRRLLASGNKQKWFALQTAYKNKLLLNPGGMRQVLTRSNKDAVNALVDPRDKEALIRISDEWNRLEASDIKTMLTKSTDIGDRAVQLVTGGTGREIRAIIAEAGGKSSPPGRALQAGVIEALLRKSRLPKDEGKFLMSKDKFLAELNRIRERGVLEDIFEPDVLKRLENNFEQYISFLPKSMGGGEGIQKATIGAGMAALPLAPLQPGKALGGLTGSGINKMWAWLFTTPGTRKFLMGKGTPPKGDTNHLRAIGGALGVVLNNMNEIANSGSFEFSEGINFSETPPPLSPFKTEQFP